jgi:hypothetical protein
MDKALNFAANNPNLLKKAENIAKNNPKLTEKLTEKLTDVATNKVNSLASNVLPTNVLPTNVLPTNVNPANLANIGTDLANNFKLTSNGENLPIASVVPNPETIVFSDGEINKIKEIMYEVIKEKIPPSLFVDKVGAFINKLATDKDNITKVKFAMMNHIFSDLNKLTENKHLKYTFIVKLLTYPDIITIVNSIKLDNNDKNFVSELKEKLLPMTSFSGGGTDDNTKDLFYKKMCRLLDADIADERIMELFIKNISDFFEKESPEKTRLFQKLANQIGVFIDQIFQSVEFRDPEFRKYLLHGLLDSDSEDVIISGKGNPPNSSQTMTDRIKNVFLKGNTNANRIKRAFQNKLDENKKNTENMTGGRKNRRKRKTVRKHKRRNLRLKTRRN